VLEHFLVAAAAHIAVDGAKEGLKKAFQFVATKRPETSLQPPIKPNAAVM
jgi:hypothetical protein